MSKFDKRGNPVSYGSQDAIDRLDRICDLLHSYQADPVAEVDALIAEHPDFALAHAFRAGAFATATDKTFDRQVQKSLRAAEALAGQANERERLHIAACRAWADGEWEKAGETWGRASIDHPRDLLALQYAHLSDFFLGYSHMLRDRVARVLPHWDRDVPGYGFVRGMYAFGLEECGEYAQAEPIGREAVALNKRDGWAVHAVAHVMEMQGRAKEGVAFLGDSADAWAPDSLLAYHIWWHKALFHIDASDAAGALKLYDETIRPGGFGQALELLDGSALLWRLQLLGHDVGERWIELADKWEPRADHGYSAFNDANAMMAFVGAGRTEAQARLIAAGKRAALGHDTNAMMSREVGVPACEGFAAFGCGDYARAIELLLPVLGKANRFGGSHAQRDMFSWTLTEAAIRAGDWTLAQAMSGERLSSKPGSPVNRAWALRIAKLSREGI